MRCFLPVMFALGAAAGPAAASEIKVIASPAVSAALKRVVPAFERETGHRVQMDFAVIAALKRRIEAGETFDVVIPSPELIEELASQGKVVREGGGPIGRTGVALGVRKGSPKPDISTPDKLKRVLLEAKAVGHSKEGQSGVHFRAALDRLGIGEEMRPKLKAYDLSEYESALERGEIDLVASGTGPILEMPGVQLVGTLPPALQSYVRVGIGVSATSKAPDASQALVIYLRSAELRSALAAAGVERD